MIHGRSVEYTALPLYHGEHEPPSVIIWAGYRQLDAKALKDPVVIEEFKAEYENEVLSMDLPYRRRLLRFDIQTNTWILLEPLCDVDVTPTGNVYAAMHILLMSLMSTSLDTIATVAQSFAAELSTNDGVTRLMIGGGYGFNILSKPAEPPNPVFSALIKQALNEVGAKPEDTFQPDCNQEVFEVEICINQTKYVLRNAQRKGLGGNGNYLTRLRMCHPSNLSYIEARQQCLCCRIFVRRTSPSLQGEKSLTTTTMQLLAVGSC